VFILKVVKAICFDARLQVLILKVVTTAAVKRLGELGGAVRRGETWQQIRADITQK
jgi:sugar (pentulose or hexulose) kinase